MSNKHKDTIWNRDVKRLRTIKVLILEKQPTEYCVIYLNLPSLFTGLSTQHALIQSGITFEHNVYNVSKVKGSMIKISG